MTKPAPRRDLPDLDRPSDVTLQYSDSQVAEAADEPTALDLEGAANLPREVEREAAAAARDAPSASRATSPSPPRRRRTADQYHRPADREVPIDGYHSMTVPEIIGRIERMSLDEMRAVQRYEGSHRRRKTLMVKLERLTRALANPSPRQ